VNRKRKERIGDRITFNEREQRGIEAMNERTMGRMRVGVILLIERET